jgi:hypothetical protein
MAKKPPLAVHIVLETSCLFTDAADKLIRDELSELVLSTTTNPEMNVTWHLPEIVRAERKHQMKFRADRLLPALEKVEKLLGHTFAITPELLEDRVEAAINREIERHKLQTRALNSAEVDLADLVARSVQRRPPFDPGEKEKGFRDAIVLETFCQLLNDLPKSPQSCRIVFMTGDTLLTSAAREKTEGRTNVAFTGDVEEVRTLLNTLASELTQETVNAILPLARSKFFEPNVSSTLYYSKNIADKISSEFTSQLSSLPEGFTRRNIKRIGVGPPTFLTKKGQRLTFSSRIIYFVQATKVIWKPQSFPFSSGITGLGTPMGTTTSSTGGSGALFGSTGPSRGTDFFGGTDGTISAGNTGGVGGMGAGALSSLFSPPPTPPPTAEEVRCEGQHVFEATWHATLTSAGNIKGAKLEKVEYKSTTWDELA